MHYKEITVNDFTCLPLKVRSSENFKVVRNSGDDFKAEEYQFTKLLKKQHNLFEEESDWSELWIKNNQLHRINGPALIAKDGSEIWFKNGVKHRNDGPAVILSSGEKIWYKNGRVQRLNGPALIASDGKEFWYQNGELHRTDGPAIIWGNGATYYYLNGIPYFKEKWFKQLTKEELAVALANPEIF